MLVFCKFLKLLNGLRQNNSQGILHVELSKLYKHLPILKIFFFCLPKLCILALIQ